MSLYKEHFLHYKVWSSLRVVSSGLRADDKRKSVLVLMLLLNVFMFTVFPRRFLINYGTFKFPKG